MRPLTLILLALFVALVAFGGVLMVRGWWHHDGMAGDRADEPVLITADDPATIRKGKALYDARCASCHGAQLGGQEDWREAGPDGRRPAPPHDDSGHTWHHPDAVLFAMTKYGIEPFAPPDYESGMPAFRGVLDDAEITAVLAYIKSTWPDAIRDRQRRMSEQMTTPPPFFERR
jgi:mono/diheme cytochrome c family protein